MGRSTLQKQYEFRPLLLARVSSNLMRRDSIGARRRDCIKDKHCCRCFERMISKLLMIAPPQGDDGHALASLTLYHGHSHSIQEISRSSKRLQLE